MPSSTEFTTNHPRHHQLLAWLDQAVTHYVLAYKRTDALGRLTALAGVRKQFQESDVVEGLACLACGEHGDHDQAAADVLAEGIALLAFQPGGVTIFGKHFDAARVIADRLDELDDVTEAACAARAGDPRPALALLFQLASEFSAEMPA